MNADAAKDLHYEWYWKVLSKKPVDTTNNDSPQDFRKEIKLIYYLTAKNIVKVDIS